MGRKAERVRGYETERERVRKGGRQQESIHLMSHHFLPFPLCTLHVYHSHNLCSPSLPPSLPHSQLLKQKNILPHPHQSVDDIIMPLDESLRLHASSLAAKLRSKGRSVELVLESKRLKW